MDFSTFDTRNYPTVSAREGYGEWSATYEQEQTILEQMDWRLLDHVRTVAWAEAHRTADLACGTGRTGVWLREHGAGEIDGVDLTPEMLEQAREKGIYGRLLVGDMTATPLDAGAYDLVTESLADEHIPDVGPLYREAARLARPGGQFVLVGYHPFFLMSGIPTHFDRASGEPLAIESHVHLFSEHVGAALDAGWSLIEMQEAVVDDVWVARKPKWERYRNRPISFVMVWERRA